jgi:hypothetical protein
MTGLRSAVLFRLFLWENEHGTGAAESSKYMKNAGWILISCIKSITMTVLLNQLKA